MTNREPSLSPATPEELEFTLTQALIRDGKKQFQSARELSATITAAQLLDQLHKQGYVVMKKPPARLHSSTDHAPPDRHLTE